MGDKIMSKKFLTILAFPLAFFLILGCMPSLSSLRTVQGTKKITLPKTYTATMTRGVGVKWVEGLSAGTYTEEAENDEGIFFRGPKDCVILLMGKFAEDFLKTGVPPSHEAKIEAGFYPGEDGGIWVPKPGVSRRARFYHYFQPKQTSGSVALIDAMINADRGKIHWGPEVEDKRILSLFGAPL
jgi:hypothetical protein